MLIAGLILALTGCHLLRDDKGLFVDSRDDYLEAKAGQPLVVPENMGARHIEDTWPIPEIAEQPAAKTFAHTVPRPKLFVGRDLDAVRIQRLGSRSWIVSGDAPSQVWPQIKQFLGDNNVGIELEDPPKGVVQSAWLRAGEGDDVVRQAIREGLGERDAARPEEERSAPAQAGDWLDRVQLTVERGIRQGSSEVHVVHSRVNAVGEAPAVTEVETQLIAKLADHLASAVSAGPVSMVGRDIASEDKARIVEDEDGVPMLLLNVDFDRAWATIGQALERAEVEVTESNRDEGVYLALIAPDGKSGFMARILPGGRKASKGRAVAIHVKGTPEGIVVNVRDPSDKPVDRDLAEEVLLTLREFAT